MLIWRTFLSRLYGVEECFDQRDCRKWFLSRLYGVEDYFAEQAIIGKFLSRLYGVEGKQTIFAK